MSSITTLDLKSDEGVKKFDFSVDVSVSPKRSLISKLKSKIGIEISSEIISLSLSEPEPFFTGEEIDSLFESGTLTPLDTSEVPDWEMMFAPTKRVKKPVR